MDDDKLTLKEEIEIEACLFEDGCHNSSVQHHFLEGAECMRKLLIEKACEWLNNSLFAFVEYDELNGINIDYGHLNKQIRKAME